MALEGIPTYQRSITVPTPALGQDLVRIMGNARTCLMRGHGITAAGPSVENASLDAIHLNELAVMNYRAHLLGNPSPISAEDQAVFRNKATTRAGKPADERAQNYVNSSWRYYCAMTGS
jgi:ribulose-5-phosphate 4-epimerase/fuculose-1-phosphate aldolase